VIDPRWLLYLALPAVWTLFFSMFSNPAIRGWRNFGWLGCYVVGFTMVWTIGWRRGAVTWLVMGLGTGLLYYVYDLWASWGRPNRAARPQLGTILHGAALWPIMLPEVIEYTLADAGALKASDQGQRR